MPGYKFPTRKERIQLLEELKKMDVRLFVLEHLQGVQAVGGFAYHGDFLLLLEILDHVTA